jgi:hypothetical protein
MLRNLNRISEKLQIAGGWEGVEAENKFFRSTPEKESAILAEFYRTMSFGFVHFGNTPTLHSVVFHQNILHLARSATDLRKIIHFHEKYLFYT